MAARNGRGDGDVTFETNRGRSSLSWTEKGVSRFTLPHRKTRGPRGARGQRGVPGEIARLVGEIQAYYRGERTAVSARLDLSGIHPFDRAVYAAARRIPAGKVRTYGEIARTIGRPRAARAVGAALGRNPIPLLIPCHRVVGVSGLGGFSAPGGLPLKKAMLALEGL